MVIHPPTSPGMILQVGPYCWWCRKSCTTSGCVKPLCMMGFQRSQAQLVFLQIAGFLGCHQTASVYSHKRNWLLQIPTILGWAEPPYCLRWRPEELRSNVSTHTPPQLDAVPWRRNHSSLREMERFLSWKPTNLPYKTTKSEVNKNQSHGSNPGKIGEKYCCGLKKRRMHIQVRMLVGGFQTRFIMFKPLLTSSTSLNYFVLTFF